MANDERHERLRNLVAADFDPDSEENNTLESLLVRIGEFGRSQRAMILALFLPLVFISFQTLSCLFTASPAVHRCNITECDTPNTEFWETFNNFTIPRYQKGFSQCHRYVFSNVTYPSCSEENFDTTTFEECSDGFIFRDENEHTVTRTFGLVCSQERKRNMVATISKVGHLLGLPFGGFFADRFGRRPAFLIGVFMSVVIGALRPLATSYTLFVALEFFTVFVGGVVFPAAFLLAIEMVRPKRRLAVATVVAISHPIGEMLLGGSVKLLHHWQLILLLPLLIFSFIIFPYLSIPESVRWLMHKGEENKAGRILTLIAIRNGKTCESNLLKVVMDCNIMKLYIANESSYPIWVAIKALRWRILYCCCFWITLALANFSVNSSFLNFGDKKHGEFIYNGCVQIPALSLPFFMMKSIGRRLSLRCSMLSYALFVIGIILFGRFSYGFKTVMLTSGKIATTCSLHILYIFTSEMFPTKVRTTMLCLCLMFGHIGFLLGPTIFSLAKLFEYAPHLLILGLIFVSAGFIFRLPETNFEILPATVNEAANLRVDPEN